MKNNLVTSILASRCGVGAVLLALCAFTPASHADVIINNTGDALAGYAFQSFDPLAQVFTMSSASGTITSLTVDLRVYSAGSASIDLYSTTLGVPNTLISTLGTVSPASTGGVVPVTLSLSSNPLLTLGTSYAIVLETPTSGQIGLDTTATSSSGGDVPTTLGSLYYNNGTWTSIGNYWQMNLQTTPVPEVPITGVVMGFGVLAIALGHTLRRKLLLSVSGIA
jgi:hypothetical protein